MTMLSAHCLWKTEGADSGCYDLSVRLAFWAILFPMTAKYAGKSANHVIRMENKDKVLYNRISAAAPLLFLIKHEICRVGITLCIRPEVMYV